MQDWLEATLKAALRSYQSQLLANEDYRPSTKDTMMRDATRFRCVSTKRWTSTPLKHGNACLMMGDCSDAS